MKFLKEDGTIEEGTALTDEQAANAKRVEILVHEVICQNAHHYDWQPKAKCLKVATAVASGDALIDALEGLVALVPKPEPIVYIAPVFEPEPELPEQTAATESEIVF